MTRMIYIDDPMVVGWVEQLEDGWWSSDDPDVMKWGPFKTREEARQQMMDRLLEKKLGLAE